MSKYTIDDLNKDLENVHTSYTHLVDLLNKYFKEPKADWDEFTTNIHNALFCYDENNELKLRLSVSKKKSGVVAYAMKKSIGYGKKRNCRNES